MCVPLSRVSHELLFSQFKAAKFLWKSQQTLAESQEATVTQIFDNLPPPCAHMTMQQFSSLSHTHSERGNRSVHPCPSAPSTVRADSIREDIPLLISKTVLPTSFHQSWASKIIIFSRIESARTVSVATPWRSSWWWSGS
jgi:hypothetical protein